MERSLILTDGDGARFLEQVGQNLGRLDLTRLCLHVDLDELAEARRVHIASRLCITEGLEQWVRVEHICLNTLVTLMHALTVSRHPRRMQVLLRRPTEDCLMRSGHIGQDNLTRFRLSRSGFARDDN